MRIGVFGHHPHHGYDREGRDSLCKGVGIDKTYVEKKRRGCCCSVRKRMVPCFCLSLFTWARIDSCLFATYFWKEDMCVVATAMMGVDPSFSSKRGTRYRDGLHEVEKKEL